jgi:hypothetical protein
VAWFFAGAALGILPLLVYNTVSFGDPLGQAVIVSGQWRLVAPRFDPAGAVSLAATYLGLLLTFTPITLCGVAGLAFFPTTLRRERLLIATLLVTHLGFVLVLNATGACQFGPRMLLPALPFAALGLAGFATLPRRRATAAVLGVVAAVSVGFNLLGAVYGTLYSCDTTRWAVARYFAAMRRGEGSSLPLLEALGVPEGAASRRIERARAASFAAEAREAVGRGDLAEARRRLDAAADMAPDLALVHQYRANVAYLSGDLTGAAAALERAIALSPSDPVLRRNLELLRQAPAGAPSPH